MLELPNAEIESFLHPNSQIKNNIYLRSQRHQRSERQEEHLQPQLHAIAKVKKRQALHSNSELRKNQSKSKKRIKDQSSKIDNNIIGQYPSSLSRRIPSHSPNTPHMHHSNNHLPNQPQLLNLGPSTNQYNVAEFISIPSKSDNRGVTSHNEIEMQVSNNHNDFYDENEHNVHNGPTYYHHSNHNRNGKSQRSSSNVSNHTDSLRISPADMITNNNNNNHNDNNNMTNHGNDNLPDGNISPDISDHSDDTRDTISQNGINTRHHNNSIINNNNNHHSHNNKNGNNTNDDESDLKEKTLMNNSESSHFAAGYIEWEGKNTILCKGRVIAGPQKCKLIQTILFVITPSALYFYSVGWDLFQIYNKMYPLIVAICVMIICLICLTITALMDPGIIPRTQEFESASDPKCTYAIQPMIMQTGEIKRSPQPPFKQLINIGGRVVTIKYCYSCKIFRPPRSFHCQICNNCIERFDHHCPWVGNCVAYRNYGYFFTFLSFLNFHIIWLIYWSFYIWIHSWNDEMDNTNYNTKYDDKSSFELFFIKFWNVMQLEPFAITLIFLGFLAIWFPLVLICFHIYLVITGQTTNEKLKNTFDWGSPFSRGILGNLSEICCKLPTKSHVHIAHKPPKVNKNEAILNKRKIVYLDNNDTHNQYYEAQRKYIEMKKQEKRLERQKQMRQNSYSNNNSNNNSPRKHRSKSHERRHRDQSSNNNNNNNIHNSGKMNRQNSSNTIVEEANTAMMGNNVNNRNGIHGNLPNSDSMANMTDSEERRNLLKTHNNNMVNNSMTNMNNASYVGDRLKVATIKHSKSSNDVEYRNDMNGNNDDHHHHHHHNHNHNHNDRRHLEYPNNGKQEISTSEDDNDRLAHDAPLSAAAMEQEYGHHHDTRQNLQTFEALRNNNEGITIVYLPENNSHHAHSTHRHRPNIPPDPQMDQMAHQMAAMSASAIPHQHGIGTTSGISSLHHPHAHPHHASGVPHSYTPTMGHLNSQMVHTSVTPNFDYSGQNNQILMTTSNEHNFILSPTPTPSHTAFSGGIANNGIVNSVNNGNGVNGVNGTQINVNGLNMYVSKTAPNSVSAMQAQRHQMPHHIPPNTNPNVYYAVNNVSGFNNSNNNNRQNRHKARKTGHAHSHSHSRNRQKRKHDRRIEQDSRQGDYNEDAKIRRYRSHPASHNASNDNLNEYMTAQEYDDMNSNNINNNNNNNIGKPPLKLKNYSSDVREYRGRYSNNSNNNENLNNNRAVSNDENELNDYNDENNENNENENGNDNSNSEQSNDSNSEDKKDPKTIEKTVDSVATGLNAAGIFGFAPPSNTSNNTKNKSKKKEKKKKKDGKSSSKSSLRSKSKPPSKSSKHKKNKKSKDKHKHDAKSPPSHPSQQDMTYVD